MGLKKGIDRNQISMFCLEDLVSAESEVRVIDAFVNWINLKDYDFVIKGKSAEGQPAYGVKDLLKLYFYGYMNRTRSSRRLEWLTKTNIEVKWLINGLTPCHMTIANFRKDNAKQFVEVFRLYNLFLLGEGVFHKDTAATDGSKFRAQNSKKNNYNKKKVQDHLNYIDKQTEKYLAMLDENDKETEDDMTLEIKGDIVEKLDQLDRRRAKYKHLEQQIEVAHEQGETQISTTDRDARALPKRMNNVEVSYNIITTVEAKNKLIINYETTNKHDTNALSTAGKKAKIALGKSEDETINLLADKGFDTGYELKKCAENNILTYVAPKKRGSYLKDPAFDKSKFMYDKDEDCYICPTGEVLRTNGKIYKWNRGKRTKLSYRVQRYMIPFRVCNACPHKMECAGKANIEKKKARYIERNEYQDYVDDNIERVTQNKELYRQRQSIVEHPYGTIKRQWGYDYTLLKGFEKVAGEFGIIFTCYNLRRSISIFGVKELIQRLEKALLGINWTFSLFLRGYRHFLYFSILGIISSCSK